MEQENKKRDKVGRSLYVLYVLFLLISLGLIGRIIYIQVFFHPDDKLIQVLTPSSTKATIEPARGAILARDGRYLAISFPSYDIHMDCTVMKDSYAGIKDREKGKNLEEEWMEKAKQLSQGLEKVLGEHKADYYYEQIKAGRASGKGRYLLICRGIDNEKLSALRALPLWNEGKFKGGMIEEKEVIRKYPYGSLAHRTIGFVRNNKSTVSNSNIGIEGKFDYILHGKDGYEWQRETDLKRKVRDNDSTFRHAEDGMDIRTTLDVDIQDIADKALRDEIQDDMGIEGGCMVIMDVKTGAIRAMVNLLRDSVTHNLDESINLAVGRLGNPGSVFKATTLMTAIEDGYVKSLDERIPTNHGRLGAFPVDEHIPDYERRNKTNTISYLDGLKMSSNYVFRYLAVKNYVGKAAAKSYIDKLYMYKLGEAYDFDLVGMATPNVKNPEAADWSGTDLGSIAIGYSVDETPLHILTFYNGIANKGKLMKPYLVEDIEQHGIVKERKGASVLNAAICSKATADTITRGLKFVTEEGTATRLKGAKYKVAGKTGTARCILDSGGYVDKWDRWKNQGTFVGFFPADEPRYSIIAVVYSTIGRTSAYGGTHPAAAVRTVVDKIYALDSPEEELRHSEQVPHMNAAEFEGGQKGVVPDLKGKGLGEAIYAIENAGFKCSYRGIGHVVRQSLKAGSKGAEGTVIMIELK